MESIIKVCIIKYLAYSHAITFDFGGTRDKSVQNRILCKPDNVEDYIL